MNNEEKILQILTKMQTDFTHMQSDFAHMQSDFTHMQSDFTHMQSDISDLKQGQEAIRKDIKDLFLYSQASFDEISRLERRVDEVNMAK